MAMVLRARARLNPGKATGPDGIRAEVVRAMPWRSVRAIQMMFCDILQGTQDPPDSWHETLTTLLPKSYPTCSMDNARRVAVENVFKKWSSTCMILLLDPYPAGASTQISFFLGLFLAVRVRKSIRASRRPVSAL
eukprot:9415522-Pyramimonas_sp.AAC.1